jgi:hypothetical protein
MSEPPTPPMKPNSHRITSATKIAQSIFHQSFPSERTLDRRHPREERPMNRIGTVATKGRHNPARIVAKP